MDNVCALLQLEQEGDDRHYYCPVYGRYVDPDECLPVHCIDHVPQDDHDDQLCLYHEDKQLTERLEYGCKHYRYGFCNNTPYDETICFIKAIPTKPR
jgi:hypothetical protein